MNTSSKNRVPEIEVGILKGEGIRFKLHGSFSFEGSDKRWQGEMEAAVSGEKIELSREGDLLGEWNEVIFQALDASRHRFVVRDVVIGIGFHWEQKEDQEFLGALKLKVSDKQIQVVNVVSVEDYLISVISSEMRGDSSPALLEAHTIISRSWLLAQIEKQNRLDQKGEAYQMIHQTEKEYIRWYDREDHHEFHASMSAPTSDSRPRCS